MKKRGQAAMEFLMTYGWAIMIILVVVAALYYLGLFDAASPARADFGTGPIMAQDIRITDNGVKLIVKASGITFATVTSMTVDGQSCGITDEDISQASRSSYDLVCPMSLTRGKKVTGEIKTTYTSIGGLSHTVTGTFSGDVAKPSPSTAPLKLTDLTTASYSGGSLGSRVFIDTTAGELGSIIATTYSDNPTPLSTSTAVQLAFEGALTTSGKYFTLTDQTSRKIKVFLPTSVTAGSTIYIADDGSTYTNSGLTTLSKAAP
jgi:hypothetical protein